VSEIDANKPVVAPKLNDSFPETSNNKPGAITQFYTNALEKTYLKQTTSPHLENCSEKN
jgi:hypothetical protein